jgi:hypothetical protein
VPPGCIHILKLNKELLPTDKLAKEKMPVSSENWTRRNVDLENGEK